MIDSRERIIELQRESYDYKKIDAHAHIGYTGGWADVGMTPEEMIRQMDEFNIEAAAVCCPDNDATLDMARRYPGRVIACAYMDPLNDSVETIKSYLKKGFSAVKLNPLRNAYCADSEMLDPFLDAAERFGVPVVIHSGHPPYSLPWQIALLAERHPDVKVLMLHMGHGHGVYIDAALKMARRHPNIYLEFSGMPMPDKILEAYQTVGADRVLFGTDMPFHHITTELQKLIVSGLDEPAIRRVLYDNAYDFFQKKQR